MMNVRYVGRNAAQVIKHKEVKHVHICDVCYDGFVGDTTFDNHKRLVHLNSVHFFLRKSLKS